MSKSDLCQCGHSREVHNYPGTQQYDDAGGTPCLACKCLTFKPQPQQPKPPSSTLHVCGKCGAYVPGWGTLCDACKAQAEKVRAELQVLADRRLEFRIKQQARERRERRGEWREACDETTAKPTDASTLYRVEYYTLSDSHTSANIRATSEQDARRQVQESGECDSIYSVSVRS